MLALTGQAEQIFTEPCPERQQASCPSVHDGGGDGIACAVYRLVQDGAADYGADRLGRVDLYRQRRRLGYEVPGCRVEVPCVEERLKDVLVER